MTDCQRERAVDSWFFSASGVHVDFENPKSFNERMQWLKAHDVNFEKTVRSDKIAVRDIIADVVGEQVLTKLYAVWHQSADVDFADLPETFMLKCNNGSGENMLVRKSRANMAEIRRQCDCWLRMNYARRSCEGQYEEITPALFAEEYISDIEWELQAWCFNGEVGFIAAIRDPHGLNEKQFFNKHWEKQPFVSSLPVFEGIIEKPDCLDELIEHSESLAKGFVHVRVDWFLSKSRGLVFSEMTFTSAAGNIRWWPEEYNYSLAHFIKLPMDVEER